MSKFLGVILVVALIGGTLLAWGDALGRMTIWGFVPFAILTGAGCWLCVASVVRDRITSRSITRLPITAPE